MMRRLTLAFLALLYTTSAFAQFQSPAQPGASLNSPAFQGSPTAPTQAIADASTLIATDQFTYAAIVRSLSTASVNLGSTGGGTYSFNSQGSGGSVVVGVSGGAITSILTVANPGSGYAVGDLITLASGNADNILRVATLSGSGIATVQILAGGTGNTNGYAAYSATVTPALARNFVLTGTLTSNVQFIALGGTKLNASGFYLVSNNTTGSYTLNVCTAPNATTNSCSGGRSVYIPQGTNNNMSTLIQSDGVLNVDAFPGYIGNSYAGSVIMTGTVPTGTTGTCTASSFVGGALAGKFSAAVCAGGTFILSGLPTAPNGYACDAEDQTTPADTLKQTANSTTSVTFTSTTAASDVVVFKCLAF